MREDILKCQFCSEYSFLLTVIALTQHNLFLLSLSLPIISFTFSLHTLFQYVVSESPEIIIDCHQNTWDSSLNLSCFSCRKRGTTLKEVLTNDQSTPKLSDRPVNSWRWWCYILKLMIYLFVTILIRI